MKIEMRNYKQITDNGWAPEINGANEFAINDDGHGNFGWIICTTEEEAAKYNKIIKKLGVANTNNIEQIICSLFVEGYTNGIEILNAIDKAGENIQVLKSRVVTDGEWWYIDPIYEEDGTINSCHKDNFCHHTKKEALYWCVIDELTLKQVKRYL